PDGGGSRCEGRPRGRRPGRGRGPARAPAGRVGVVSLFRLHPHLQHAIVNDLGWRDLRPVQAMTIDAVLDGANSVLLAPTAGGKTEAAIFPVLSQILSERRPAVSALYVCPIKAL